MTRWASAQKNARTNTAIQITHRGRRTNSSTHPHPRYIPSTIRHAVFLRDKGVCQNCGTSRAIQVEHIKPFAKNGEHTVENLKLLCRSCNQRAAIESYGFNRMGRYFSLAGERLSLSSARSECRRN